eukprot:tig00020909_g15326.t1
MPLTALNPEGDAAAAAAAPTGRATTSSGGARRKKPGDTGNDSEDAINLSTLMELKEIFDRADVDGGGSLDMEEFIEAFGGVIGKNMTPEQLQHLFMKIDANSDGGVDWDEFSTFMLLESQGTATLREGVNNEYVETDEGDGGADGVYHKDMIDRVLFLPNSDKYITTSRDGTLRIWNATTLAHMKTVRNDPPTRPNDPQAKGPSWITDCAHMTLCNKLAVASIDRSISFYDAASMECVGRIRDLDNAPLCLGYWPAKERDMLAFGDDAGYLHVYHMYDGVLEGTKLFKQKTHKDWVTKVRYVPEMASLVSSSLDNTIKVGDVEKKQLKVTLEGHSKGVYSFDWCRTYKFFASCGLERHIVLWNPYTSKAVATLHGHNASVQEVIVNDWHNQLISLSVDKVIKVWDVRNHRCLQTIVDKEKHRPENRISACLYDFKHSSLVTATTRLHVLPMQRRDENEHGTKSHERALGGALYNHTFHQIVSADESGAVCVWDLDTGDIVFRFSVDEKQVRRGHPGRVGPGREGRGARDAITWAAARPPAARRLLGASGASGAGREKRITSLAFDAAGRRLITGFHDGEVKVRADTGWAGLVGHKFSSREAFGPTLAGLGGV